MSWLPTLRIARAAWKGSQDPAGLLKAQLSSDERAPAPTPAPLGTAPGAPAPLAAAVTERVAEPAHEVDHAHVVLLLR